MIAQSNVLIFVYFVYNVNFAFQIFAAHFLTRFLHVDDKNGQFISLLARGANIVK